MTKDDKKEENKENRENKEDKNEEDKNKYYKKVGLRAGIEIHQQLDTHKLFCECPSLLRNDKPDIIIKRYLYAAAGETGKVDIAAAYEESRKKEFIYQAYSDTTCLVELDEEPPHSLNKEALHIALQIALLLNAKPLSVTQIMRKTVVDGSNTSGFQRTMLIAKDGFVKIMNKKIGISSICLEEDSARKIRETEKEVVFRLDRLGIPLVEIATAPDISSPEEAKLVALKIGEILRSCKVKRGIGTIRQDVNISIKNHPRVEIKGFQDPRMMIKTIELEIGRQKKESKEGKGKPEVRKAMPDGTTTFLRPLPGASRMYPETDLPLVRITKKMIQEARKTLPKIKEDIIKDLESLGINEELAKVLIQKNKLELFNRFFEQLKIKPAIIARTITLTVDSIKSHYNLTQEQLAKLDESVFFKTLKAYEKNLITKDAIELVLLAVCKNVSIDEAINQYKKMNEQELEKKIEYLILKHRKKL